MFAAKSFWAAGAIAIAGCAALPRSGPQWPAPREATTDRATALDVHDVAWPAAGESTTSVSVVSLEQAPGAGAVTEDAERIEKLPVCVGSRRWSAGKLGDTVLYREHRVGKRLEVGYFVYWSTERPWGQNVLSYTVVPALLIDATYSHFLWVLPGFKDVLHGAADVEGIRVELEDRDGELRVVGGTADDGFHHGVQLSREDLVDSRGRIVLLTDVWSHQFGAHGGAAFAGARSTSLRCYEGATLRPMTKEIATAFRLGSESAPRRAKPAWRNAIAQVEPRE
ncbi:MAG TPA: hypothetical protein VHU80_13585 [Polyangiaceae bacterium]|jgi:hypothetical protein|nr:hypothetical protein [Polyangiaceae bacterium]